MVEYTAASKEASITITSPLLSKRYDRHPFPVLRICMIVVPKRSTVVAVFHADVHARIPPSKE